MALERKSVPYEAQNDPALQGFLRFTSIPLEKYAKDFHTSGSPEDYLLFVRRLDSATQEEKEQLTPFIQEIRKTLHIQSHDWVLLGHACENGIDYKKNEIRAAKYFEKGDQIGCFALGRMLLNKRERADQWQLLANKYTNGWEAPVNDKLAAEFSSKALEEGKNLVGKALSALTKIHPASLLIGETHFLMFDAYSKMNPSPEIQQLMIQCCKKALEKGCPRVHPLVLNWNRTHINIDIYQYNPLMIQLLQNATQMGYVKECLSLAKIMHNNGDYQCHLQRTYELSGTPEKLQMKKDIRCVLPEYVRARIYSAVLSSLGNISALELLATAIVLGDGTTKDKLKALKIDRLAAEQSLMQREDSPNVVLPVGEFKAFFIGNISESAIKAKIKALKDEKIELIYHSLLGLHTCRLWEKDDKDIQETANYFNYLVTEHEDAVLALIQLKDIPSLKRILNADMAEKLDAKHQIQFNALKNELRSGENKFPHVLENIILDFAGMPHTFFGTVKKPVSETKDVEMKLAHEDVTQPSTKKRRSNCCSRILGRYF